MTMTLESAFSSVREAAGRLDEAARDLVLIAVEDQPHDTDVHLVTIVHDAALDLTAEAEQATAPLRSLRDIEESTGQVSSAVVVCQARVNAFGALLVRHLAAAERLGELAQLGAEHGREAGAWATEIIRCIQTCQNLLWTDIQPALLAYWQELACQTSRTCVPSEER
jgi:hypothetical protein